MLAFWREEFRRHRWMGPGLLLTGSAAFGTALPDIVDIVHRVLR